MRNSKIKFLNDYRPKAIPKKNYNLIKDYAKIYHNLFYTIYFHAFCIY